MQHKGEYINNAKNFYWVVQFTPICLATLQFKFRRQNLLTIWWLIKKYKETLMNKKQGTVRGTTLVTVRTENWTH